MLKHWVFAILVVPALCTPLQSWPAWKAKYDTYAAGKKAYELKDINTRIEGSTQPTVATEQLLWSWYSEVSAGTEKTAAKTLMDTTYTDLGGDSVLVGNFISDVGTAYGAQGTLALKYTKVYQQITAKFLDSTATPSYALYKRYNTLTAAQKKSVQASLEKPLATQWNTDWAAATNWANADTYKKKTVFISKVMNNHGAVANANDGKACYEGYKAAKDNKDKVTMAVFDRKMAALIDGSSN